MMNCFLSALTRQDIAKPFFGSVRSQRLWSHLTRALSSNSSSKTPRHAYRFDLGVGGG